MFRLNKAFVLPLVAAAFAFSACSKGPEKETVTLQNGAKVEMTAVQNDPAFDKAFTKTITGKIELVSVHPSPAALPPEVAKGTYIVSVLTDTNERVFPVDSDGSLRKNAGKTVTFSGRLSRQQTTWLGKAYDRYEIVEVQKIQ